MSHTMKTWERIIDRRLREETTIGDEQCGFMPGRGTTDAIFAVRQLMEKHREKQKGLHMVYNTAKCVAIICLAYSYNMSSYYSI